MSRFLFIVFIFASRLVASQTADTTINQKDTTHFFSEKQKLNTLLITGSTLYTGSLIGLYHLWYKDYPQSKFHWFNDNDEWFQMDKTSHATNAYYMGFLGYNTLTWAGLEKNKSIWYGGFLGSFYLTVIEILDGFSAGWGASWGDIIANTSGSLLFSAQQSLWNNQYISLKHSFMPSPYATYRPNLLGSNHIQSIMKDYNGISNWASFNIKPLFKNNDKFPDWICISIGQSGDGMIGAKNNPTIYQGQLMPEFVRQRQIFLSGDIDLTKFPVRSKTLRTIFKAASFIKFPFPAIEFNKTDGVKLHALYF